MFRSDQGADNKERQMTISEYEKIGECICKVTMTFLPFPNCKARLQSVTQKIASLLSEHYIKSLGLHCTNEGKEENNHPLKPVIYIEKTNDIANLSVLEEVQEDDLQGKNNIEGPKTFRHKYERNKFKHIENNLKIEENLLPNANLKLIEKEIKEEVELKESVLLGEDRKSDKSESDDDFSSTESDEGIRKHFFNQKEKGKINQKISKRNNIDVTKPIVLAKFKHSVKPLQQTLYQQFVSTKNIAPTIAKVNQLHRSSLKTSKGTNRSDSRKNLLANSQADHSHFQDLIAKPEEFPLTINRIITLSTFAQKTAMKRKKVTPSRYGESAMKEKNKGKLVSSNGLCLQGLRLCKSPDISEIHKLNKTQNMRNVYNIKEKVSEKMMKSSSKIFKELGVQPKISWKKVALVSYREYTNKQILEKSLRKDTHTIANAKQRQKTHQEGLRGNSLQPKIKLSDALSTPKNKIRMGNKGFKEHICREQMKNKIGSQKTTSQFKRGSVCNPKRQLIYFPGFEVVKAKNGLPHT